MLHTKAHKTKWTILYLKSGAVTRFNSEESARSRALTDGDTTPVVLIAPIYAFD
jgi:hypothetical protein